MSIDLPISKSLIRLENICIIGNGGRENSLAWAIQKNESVKKVYLIPGNAGSERINKCEMEQNWNIANLGQRNLCKAQIFQLQTFGK